MKINVSLYSTLREKLPPEKRGKAEIELSPGSTIRQLLEQLQIHIHVVCAVNGQIETDFNRVLADGDEVRIFRPVGGGISPGK